MSPRANPVDEKTIEEWRELESQGVSRTKIAAMYGTSRQRMARILGTLEGTRPPRNEIHVYVDPRFYPGAVSVAERYDLRHGGGINSGQGSVGKLLDKIGSGELVVIEREA